MENATVKMQPLYFSASFFVPVRYGGAQRLSMNYFLVVIAIGLSSAAFAKDPAWLTIMGDARDAAADTLEVDATSAMAFESMRLVKMRVNRASPRVGYDGQAYRSYYSTAVVDCAGMKAWHRSLALFNEPLWSGQIRLREYTQADNRPVAFADMTPNPRERLLKAACAIALPG
jgi:hypothetical protein